MKDYLEGVIFMVVLLGGGYAALEILSIILGG